MAISVTVGGVDRTDKVEVNSLKIDNVLTRKRDTATFNVLVNPATPYNPVIGQQVTISLDGVRKFGGVIVNLDQQALSYKLIRWKVICEDFTRLLDRRLIPDIFENQTIDQIIEFLRVNYFPSDFSTAGVNAPFLINYIAFSYKPLSKCIEELANISGYDWYVDQNKVLYFFQTNLNIAAHEIEDDNGTMVYDSLVIRRDNSQIRNVIIVRGGEYEAANFTAEIMADGVEKVFGMPYKFALPGFAASITGEQLSVGRDPDDDPDDFDVLLNNDEKILRFKEEDIPSNGATLRYGGKPLLPVIVKLKSPASISTLSMMEGGDGMYEYLIVDKNINSREGARQRAQAELQTYAETLSEGDFRTHTEGFRAGQKVRINSVTRGIDEFFIINRVIFQQFDSGSFMYEVSLITTKSFDLVDLLIQLSLKDTKQIEIKAGEQIDLIESFQESIGPSDDNITTQALDYPVEFSAGNFTGDVDTPQGVKRIFLIEGSPLH